MNISMRRIISHSLLNDSLIRFFIHIKKENHIGNRNFEVLIFMVIEPSDVFLTLIFQNRINILISELRISKENLTSLMNYISLCITISNYDSSIIIDLSPCIISIRDRSINRKEIRSDNRRQFFTSLTPCTRQVFINHISRVLSIPRKRYENRISANSFLNIDSLGMLTSAINAFNHNKLSVKITFHFLLLHLSNCNLKNTPNRIQASILIIVIII